MVLKKLFLSIFITTVFCVGASYGEGQHPDNGGDCQPGQYLENENCYDCPRGFYCVNNVMTICHAHSIAPSMGMTSCTYCSGENLRYSDMNHIKCVACDGIDEYGDNGVCRKCNAGSFADNEHETCISCGEGYYMDNGECKICPLGYACSGDGTAVICPKGSYSDEEGLDACKVCDEGLSTPGAGATSCNTCDVGFRRSGKDCVACSAGYSCPGGELVASICPKGFYADSRSGNCVACETGYSTVGKGSTSMLECSTCEKGYYKNGNECQKCDAGYSCPGGEKQTTICPKGSYSDEGAGSCTKCPIGYTTDAIGTVFSENPCIIATVKLKFGKNDENSVELPPCLTTGKINSRVVKSY